MEIIHVAPPFLPIREDMEYGGIERVIICLMREQRHAGHEVRIIAPSDSSIEGLIPTDESISMDEFSKQSFTREEMTRLMKKKSRHNSKIVYAMDQMSDEDAIFHIHYDHLGPFFPFIKVPFVFTLHLPFQDFVVSGNTHEVPANGRLVSISEKQRKFYKIQGYKVANVVYNGLDPDLFEYSAEKDDYLLSLSGIKPHKGQHIAIEVAKKAGRPLIIAGNVADADYFNEEVKPHIDHDISKADDKLKAYYELPSGPKIVFTGPVDDLEKRPLYARASKFLMPVKWDEPFGLVNIESLASGTPIIAFAKGALPEIVDDGVTGAICRTVPEMVSAVSREYSAEACRKSFMERFSSKAMADSYERVYKDTLNQKL